MTKIPLESCYGDVFSNLKFTVNTNEFMIIPKRDTDIINGWIISIYKNGKEIVSKSCKTVGNLATNKRILQIKEEYSKSQKTQNYQ